MSEDAQVNEQGGWEQRHELLLKEWGEIASGYQWLHGRSYRRFNRRSNCAVVTVMLITALVATFNFTSNSFAFENSSYLSYVAGLMGYLSTTVTGVASKMGLESLAKRHREYQSVFGGLSREIRTELSLPVSERSSSGADYVRTSRARLDGFLQSAPSVPESVLRDYRKGFGNSGVTMPAEVGVRSISLRSTQSSSQSVEV